MATSTVLCTALRANRPPNEGPPLLADDTEASESIVAPSEPVMVTVPPETEVTSFSAPAPMMTSTSDWIRLPAITKPSAKESLFASALFATVAVITGTAVAEISTSPPPYKVTLELVSVTRVIIGLGVEPVSSPRNTPSVLVNRLPGSQPMLLNAKDVPMAGDELVLLVVAPPSTVAVIDISFSAMIEASP